jgi:PAS domain S-box-containing protein
MSGEPVSGTSAEQYRLIVEGIPHLVWVARPDGAAEYWNGRFRQYTGVSLTEVLGYDWQRVIHPDDLPATLRAWDLSLGSGEPHYCEHRIRRADGAYRWHATRAVPLRDERGRIVRWLGTCTDIEERKAAEEALRASEQRFRAIIEKSFDCINLNAADGTILYASPSSVRTLGYSPEEDIGRNALDRIHPDEYGRVHEQFRRLLRNPGGCETAVLRGQHKDGSWRWLEARGTNLLEDPAVRAVVVNFRDITEKKWAEEAMARDALLLANVRDSVIVTDLEGVVTYWNEGATRLFGWTASEMLGRSLTERLPEAERAEALDWIGRIRAGTEFEGEWQDYRKDGSRIWLHARTSLIKDAAGRPVAIMGLSYDISEQKSLEERLRQSQMMEAVGRLAGGIAHDFNNLLTVVNGYGDMLLSDLRPDDPRREIVVEVRKAGERAAELTRQLLAFGRKQVLAPQVLDLNGVVSEMGKLLRRTIGEDIELILLLKPGLAPVQADRGQMEQVILNLAVNARDAMPRGGKLVIRTGDFQLDEDYSQSRPEVTAGPYVLLELRDSGCGMRPEVKSHIFEPFFTTKGVGKGTELGLAVVHGVVSQSGGFIEVDSEPGSGTSFRIYLPRSEPSGQPTPSVAEFKAVPRGSETVLLVEDEKAVREVNRLILVRGGYSVLEARDGSDALSVAARHRWPIHLLVADVVMPGMGGRQLAERLSAVRPEMKVLFVSGYPDDAVVEYGIREGEVHFLQKPFSPSVLARKVRDVLDTILPAVISPSHATPRVRNPP